MANPLAVEKPEWELHHLNNNPEHNLYESYIVEFTDISGIVVDFYIRDTSISLDTLYGESVNTAYLTPQRTKIIYEVTEEISSTTPFGIVSEDMIQYGFMPKYTFSRDVSGSSGILLPKPGDVIKTIWNERAYEIVDVGEEAHIFQLKKLVYEFILKPFRFSEQSQSAKDITDSDPLSAFGDNNWIEDESDGIDNYTDVDEAIYGY